jgi:hypothetical protein
MQCQWNSCFEIFQSQKEKYFHLLKHVEEYDKNDSNFKCKILKCKYKSVFKRDVKKHIHVHVEYFPFKCDKCMKTFKRKITKRHKRGCKKEVLPFQEQENFFKEVVTSMSEKKKLKTWDKSWYSFKSKCNICELQFDSISEYEIHSFSHNLEFKKIVDFLFA